MARIYQDGQDESAKVWKTLMSIERRCNKEKRSVRTLIAIAPLKQDGQDLQDGQDEGAKVWKTFMSIDAIGATRRKGPADLNRYRTSGSRCAY